MLWTIEKIIKKGDYLYCIVRDHPNRTKNNYVLLHRVIVENDINRLLTSDEIIHHIDENKFNNDLSNLKIMTQSEHQILHKTIGLSMVKLKCPSCEIEFDKEKRCSFLEPSRKCKFTCCSNTCRGKFSRRIQLEGYNEDIQNRINKNLIKEYHSNPIV
jgi:HNH endonuclease